MKRYYLAAGVFILPGCLALAGAFWHEYLWFARRKHPVVKGRIVGELDEGTDGYAPIVEYTFGGQTKRFTSSYSSTSRPEIGEEVKVTVPPDSQKPEVYSAGNRLIFTLGFLLFAVAFITIGFMVTPTGQ